MNYILTYDISNNRIRRIVSELLIDSGFIRVQHYDLYKNTVLYM